MKKQKKEILLIDSKNFGPVSSKALADAGITTLAQLKKMGWEKAAIKLVEIHPRFINLNMFRALIGACHDCDWKKIPEKDLLRAKNLILLLKN